MRIKWYFSLLTPLLLFLAWPTYGWSPLVFVSLVPLLLSIEYSENQKPMRAFWLAYLNFALFNLLNGYWIGNAHWSGTVAVIVINGAELAFAFLGYAMIKKRVDEKRAMIGLATLWISVESIHKYWEVSWPWLYLGNTFSEDPEWVQWYEYTGAFGGSLWVVLVNVWLFFIIKKLIVERDIYKYIWRMFAFVLVGILIPITISYRLYYQWKTSEKYLDVVVVQPNVDAYEEKFTMSPDEAAKNFMNLANEYLDDKVNLLVGPETMLPRSINEDGLRFNSTIKFLDQYKAKYPYLSMIVGATTYEMYDTQQPPNLSARPFADGSGYYDMYNTAVFFPQKDPIEWYHKSKLVVGVEKMPFMSVLKPLMGEVAIDLGGTAGSLGVQADREVFSVADDEYKVGSAICYESVYGEFYGGFVRRGANFMTIITNDDWWGDTPGHQQHFSYARLRAIETRRAIARSANTGISGFINSRGDVEQRLEYKKGGALRGKVEVRNDLTFYTRYGDMLVGTSWFVILVLGISIWVKSKTKR